jgi:two-component system sensor histidine kinase QseC
MNLCDNAVDYTSAGGKISLVVDRVDRRGRIRVANVTHDLTAADLPRIFDRFWRRELARTSSPHFGLGLSLSQMFATAMNWSLTAELDATGRVVFSLVSPDSDGK